MDDRIKSKRVGKVNICEIMGNFRDGFARRGKAALSQLAQAHQQTPDLFINVSELESIDAYGIEVLAETAQRFNKKAVLLGKFKPETEQRLGQFFQIVQSPVDAAQYFSREFAAQPANLIEVEERRGFVRLKTVIPTQFYLRDAQDVRETFFAVTTNLSEGGLYAEFIDSETEVNAVKRLDPLELKLLNVELALTPGLIVSGEAKVVHVKRGEGGIGMEFYRFSDEDRLKLTEWLGREFIEGSASQQVKNVQQEFQGGNFHEKV